MRGLEEGWEGEMAKLSASALARIEKRMEESFGLVLARMEKQREPARLTQETARTIRERLTPGESEKPALGEMPVLLIKVAGNADRRAARILTRLKASGQELPADIVMLLDE